MSLKLTMCQFKLRSWPERPFPRWRASSSVSASARRHHRCLRQTSVYTCGRLVWRALSAEVAMVASFVRLAALCVDTGGPPAHARDARRQAGS